MLKVSWLHDEICYEFLVIVIERDLFLFIKKSGKIQDISLKILHPCPKHKLAQDYSLFFETNTSIAMRIALSTTIHVRGEWTSSPKFEVLENRLINT